MEEIEPNPIMESWDAVVTLYPDNPEPIDYAKAIRTANIIVDEDLAPFETEWLTKTLLFKPIRLFETIKSNTKRNDEAWVKYIADSIKLLSKLIETHWDVLESYNQELVELCSLSYDTQTRKEAILCLLKVVKQPSVALTDEFVVNVINAFEKTKTCKGPLAELVGALCRYFPEIVRTEGRCILIWRTYLNMFKNPRCPFTNTVLIAVLKGTDDLLASFWEDIDPNELNEFYDLIIYRRAKSSKAFEVIISLLEHHAGLFKEKLAKDERLRNYFWQIEQKNAMEALIKIYQHILPTRTENQKQEILAAEIKPRIASGSILVKHTALKVLMQASAGQAGGEMVLSSGENLEYQLRSKRVDYDEAATISWCIESNLSNSGNMLRTSIMFYDNLPSNKKKDIVVNGIFKVNNDVRKTALILLLKLSLQEGLDKYIDVWRSILDNNTGPDLDKAVMIFQETVHYILQDLVTTLGDQEKSFTDVKPILSLLTVLLSLQQTEHSTPKWCHAIVPSIVHLARFYTQEPVKMIQEMPDDEMPYVEIFKEDTVYKTLLTLMSTDRRAIYDGTLSSFQAIFSKEDNDYKVLIKILANLETVIEENSSNLDQRQLSLVINQIDRLKSKIVLDNKDARVFQKDVIMFLAKYGQMCLQGSFSEDMYALKLKNKVYFNIPNIVQGSTLKIDIQRILQLCLLRGETDALYCVLVILTAHLHDRPDPDLQEATIRFIHEIFRSISGKRETEIAMHPALFMCNTTACVQSIIKGITEELDPKVRRKLSEHLQLLLTQDPGSEITGELLNVVAEHSSFMMARDEASVHLPDLDILRAFLQSIVDNNALITEYLPKILIFTSKINDATDIFENASISFIEKIDLFTHDQILEVIKKVIENYSVNLVNTELIINNIVSFIKRVFEIKEFGAKIIIDILLSMLQALTVISPQFSHLVTLLVYLNLTFEFDNGLRRMIVEFDNSKILEQLLKMDNFEENEMNAGFLFLREFADELLEISSEKTYQCLGLVIENVTPQSVNTLKSNITSCLSVYQSKQKSLSPINENIQNWFKKINIEELTTLIEKWFKSVNPDELITDIETRESFANVTKEISEKVHALKIMSEYFKFEFDAKILTFIAIENIDEKLSKILLIDLLIVCEKHLSDEDFLFVLQNKFDFLKNHVGVFFKRIISKPYVIKKEECSILIDVMNYFATAFDKDCYQDVLDFIDYLWPSFQESTDFEGKLSVLTNVLRLPETVDLSCLPVVWASALLTSQQTSLKDKIKILSALPAGEQFSSLYRAFATNVPVRISEMEGNEKYVPAFRAVLDSLAINGDMTLLDIVLTLARGDETKGWWDYAFSACMKSLATKEDSQILNEVYKKVVEESPSMTVCNRILLPLLGHTSRKFFEEYLCTIITELLQTLKSDVIEASDSKHCKKRLIKYAIVVNILKIAFNNLSTACLEGGEINERAGSTAPWHFLKTTCKYCVTASRKIKCPTDASEELKQICLWLQTTLYNCLSTAICRWQITEKLCAELFNVDVWARIVDREAVHPFYLKSYVRSRDSVKPAKRALNSMASTSSFTGTVRSTIFLTTLSENPLHFDLLPNDDDEEDEDEIISEFEDNSLNSHGCLSTITYLLEHASKLEYHGWRDAIVTALDADTVLHTNARWMIAQAICNASEHLKPHATALCPALFKLVADTSVPSAENGKPVLNNLHVEVLSTIIKWDLKDLPHTPTMDKCTQYLINTCMANKTKYYIHKRLLDILNGVLQLYGKHIKVQWDIFEDYLHELPKSLIPILPIFEKLLKNGVSLPNLLGATFANVNATHWINNGTKLSEVSGLALSKTDSVTRSENLDVFWKILASVRASNVGSYIKMLFYAQKSCPECCDGHNLRIITGLASKIEKSKCLTIISTYLEHAETVDNFRDIIDLINLKELFDSDVRVEAMKIARHSLEYMDIDLKKEILKSLEQNCRSSSTSVRKEAFRVFLKAFQDLVKRDPVINPAKRKALDSTPILDIVDSASALDGDIVKMVSDGMFDRDLMVAREVCEGVEECLSDDLSMRFAELFYIIVYQHSLTDNDSHLSNYGSKLIEMLFSGLRKEESFMRYKLRDEGLPQSILKAFQSTTTHTMTMRTSLRSGVAYRHKENTAPEKREIDLQMPITDILEVFIKVSKINSQICQELCVQIMKCLAQTGRRFNLDAVIAKYLSHIIKRKPFYPTPLILDACRIFISDISGIEGFLDSVKSLKQAVCNSEAYLYTNILFEDLLIRNNDKNLFLFGSENEDYDATMDEQGFTMEGLIQAFGSLANWNDLRLQDKKRIEDTLPRLWISNEDFTVSLRDYFENNKNNLDPGLWFNKMLASYYPDEIIQNKWSWLKHIEKWPKKDFDTSAIIEAIEWHENEAKMFGSISHNDCLVEWSARLMIRWSYYNQLQDSGSDYPGTISKQELLWCREANERGLPSLALQCIDRNKQNNIPQDEILPWFLEKVKAYKGLGLKQNDLGMLQKALDAAETHSQVVSSDSSIETNINMQKVILDLHHDLNSLSKMTLDDVLQEVSAKIQDSNNSQLSYNSGSALKSIYDTALAYYDDMWTDSDEIFQNELILAMTGIIDKVLDYNLTTDCNLLLATPFNRLAHFDVTISDVAAKALLDQIYRVFPRLDFCSIAILKKIMSVLPATVVNENYLSRLQDVELDTCKQYFQLICDVNYALSQFCEDLRQNVFNDEEFEIIFKKMKDQIFENQYGGTDYQSLSTLKNKLYALKHMDDIDTKAQELKLIRDELLPKTSRTTLRLSQLCPDLCSPLILESKRLHLQRLLRLPPNVHVVKFIEQVTVFTDSIRRPCVIKALLSDGQTRRYICKGGEPMLRDASIQRAISALPLLTPLFRGRSYYVTPLGEDSAILEYLEDHIRLRELMDVEIPAHRMNDEKLILAPRLALEQFNEKSAIVTPYNLRSAIESNSSCVQEFIAKKRNFEDTLSSMTILSWIFGVGDRHLQNIMYNTRDGGVCAVDWATIFKYGRRELPPARLTANLLAVCDVKVLECRLQQLLLFLRNNKKSFETFLKTSFYWLGPEFKELIYINKILRGDTVSYTITRECLEESEIKNKDKYIALLDDVFQDLSSKDTYTVEEQISYLLRQCIHPSILSVTRSGWEAWI